MIRRRITFSLLVTVALLLALTAGLIQAQGPAAGDAPLAALSTQFTYQGQLKAGGAPVSALCDFRFGLFDAATGGAQIGATQDVLSVSVVGGYFTAPALDFGGAAFQGDARWLEVAVRCPAGSGSYTNLSPRQALTAAPYALYARTATWGGLSGMPDGFADSVDNDLLGGLTCANGQTAKWSGAAWVCGADNDTTYAAGPGLTLTGDQFSINTTVIQARVTGACGAGQAVQVINVDGTVGCVAVDAAPANAWLLAGNAGTTPGADFMGTTDNQALELKVNRDRALRLEPDAISPNIVGGHPDNRATTGVHGAAIGGGGAALAWNWVTDHYGTVAGGANNWAGDSLGVVSDQPYATVGGGEGNRALGAYATIGGGETNQAAGRLSSVSGGQDNSASANGAAVGGGAFNTASGASAVVAGGLSNVATGEQAAIGGGDANRASGHSSVVGGGRDNVASGPRAVIGGGYANDATALAAAVGGGDLNEASGQWSTVAGGQSNRARADYATIAGGGMTDPLREETGNRVTDNYGVVGGGGNNQAGNGDADVGNAPWATVGGGRENTATAEAATTAGGEFNAAAGNFSVINGGTQNAAAGNKSVIGGGHGNRTNQELGTIGGGAFNVTGDRATVGGGTQNQATGYFSTVSGGYANTASGSYATVPGGLNGQASRYGQWAFAGGMFASIGDAQSSVFVLRRITSGAEAAELFLNGADQRLTLASGQTMTFEIWVVARSSAGQSAGYRTQGVIENVGGATAFVGPVTVTALGEDDASWDCLVQADNAADALVIKGKGAVGANVRWVATVRTTEVLW